MCGQAFAKVVFRQGYSSMCDREWANDDDKAVIDSAG